MTAPAGFATQARIGSNPLGSHAKSSRPCAWPVPIAVISSCAGLLCALVLFAAHRFDLSLPCGVAGGCDRVAHHPGSNVGGIPIAAFGVVAYSALLILLGRDALSRRTQLAALAITVAGSFASAGLLAYAHFVIQATCWWCVGSAVSMAAATAAAVALWRRGRIATTLTPRAYWTALFCTALLTGTALGLIRRASEAAPVSSAELALVPPSQLIDPAKTLGPEHPAFTIVEFADLRCPACRSAHASLRRFQQAHASRLRLAFRHVPLAQIPGHEASIDAAAWSEFAAESGQFPAYLEENYAWTGPTGPEALPEIARRAGLDVAHGARRLANPHDPARARVAADLALAARLKIAATPSFVIVAPGQPAFSLSHAGLARFLNSPETLARLNTAGDIAAIRRQQ